MNIPARFAAFGLALLVFVLAGCGRDALAERCASDDDCRAGRICLNGMCAFDEGCVGDECGTNNGQNNGQNNGTANNGTVNNGTVNNGVECFENDMGLCVSGPCGTHGCPVCDLGCPPDRTQVGCECVTLTCEENDECPGNWVCFDGGCVECIVDSQCADDEACQSNKCVGGVECRNDADCPPNERCAGDDTCRPRPACVFDDDCPRGQLCIGGTCTLAPECQVDLDCPPGMECVGGNCFQEICRGPDDCEPGLLCDGGECVEPPMVVMCEVATPDQLIIENQRVPLEAFAYDQNGNGVAATFTWTSSNTPVARVVPGPTAVGGNAGGVASLTATLTNGQQCNGSAELTNPGPPPMNTLRVVVTDAESGAAISGATVRVGASTAMTNAAGVASLPDPPTPSYEVSAFHTDYNWLTVQSVTARDVRLPLLRQSGSGPVAGFTGEFDTSQLHSSGNITLGLAGSSLAGGIMELSLDRLLGETFVTYLDIVGEDIPLPGGLVAYGGALGFDVDLKRTYYVQTKGGPRIAWGLAGLLPFSELLDFFMGGGGFEGEDILGQLLPLFSRFDHGAQPRVFSELPRIVDSADIDRDGDTTELLPDYLSFPVIDLRPAVRQNLTTDVAISNFPVLSDGRTGLAIVVGGVVLPTPGFVPTGITASNDENGDGRPDARRLSIAPAYGSLVGGRYAIVAITFGGSGGGIGPGGFELPEEFSVAFWNGQSFPTALSLGTFPDGSMTAVNNGSRQVSVSASAGPVFRVRMVGNDRSWDVWSLGPPGMLGQYAHTISVPAAPTGGQDLFQSARILVDAIQTNVNIDDLVGPSGVGLTNAGLVSTAYNRTAAR